jgi:protoporphyrinogen oxidase
VVSTLPTPILSTLIRDHDSAFADQLDSIDYMGAICTILAFDRSISPVYWLNVADPGYDFGGVIEQTHLVPPSHYDGMHLVYLSRYVHWDHPLWTMNDEELLDRQVSQLTRLLPAVNDAEILQSWVFRGQYAAPVTDLGFYQRIPSFDTPVDGLYMASMPHIYPDERSTNNSIRIAAAVVEEMGRDVNDVPEGTSLAATYGYRPPDTRSPR